MDLEEVEEEEESHQYPSRREREREEERERKREGESKKKIKEKRKIKKEKKKKVGRASPSWTVIPASGVPGVPASLLTDGGWVVVVDGQAKSKKIVYFKNLSKTIRYFFLVVSLPLRRVFKTFSKKNSKKIKKNKFVKKFRTTFFFSNFFEFFIKKSIFLEHYSIFISSCFFAP